MNSTESARGDAEDAGGEAMSQIPQNETYWKIPLRDDCLFFVDSSVSDEFLLLQCALGNAAIMAMDAEWRPVSGGSGSTSHPRVAILQIACRLRGKLQVVAAEKSGIWKDTAEEDTMSGLTSKAFDAHSSSRSGLRSWGPVESNCTNGTFRCMYWKGQLNKKDITTTQADPILGNDAKYRTYRLLSTGLSEGHDFSANCFAPGKETRGSNEVVFVLDMLALHPSEFYEMLKAAFVDPGILKLGFGFKQDLLHLRATFSGPEAYGCFDKVEPYLDVGVIYRNLCADEMSFMHRGRRIAISGCNLSSVTETLLGQPLRKDMQCSNWEQRPLTVPQFEYAAADVCCLISILNVLQVKAFDRWFLLSPADRGADVVGGTFEWEVAGLQCLVSSEFAEGQNVSTVSQICHPKRVPALVMAKLAMRDNSSSQAQISTSSHLNKAPPDSGRKAVSTDALVRRFGQKLLVSELSTSKRIRKNGESRGVRDPYKGQQIVRNEKNFPYVGPPPWDEALGGNGTPKFLCDAMVEGLARQLRCVGIDAASLNSQKCEPREMVDLAEKEGRIILTRDVQLLRRKIIPPDLAHRVTKEGKWDQLAEVIETFKLTINEDQLLSRCTKCNGHFFPRALRAEEVVAQRDLRQVIPECALRNVHEFWQCSSCKHLYWQGTMFTRAHEQFMTMCQTGKFQQIKQ